MPTKIIFISIEDQKLLQIALPVTIDSITSVYLSYHQPPHRKSYPTQIQTSYISCQFAFE